VSHTPDDIATWERLLSPACESLRARAADTDPTDVAAIARLRKKHDAETVRAALRLAEARRKLARKWAGAADTLVADPEGAEMASGALAARHKARRFADAAPAAPVFDLCSGIGADAVALADAGLRVTAIDRDPLRAWMTGRNAGCAARAGDAEAALESGALDGVRFHLDPSRRDDAGRRIRYDQLTPGPAFIEPLCEGRSGAVKLPPGIDPGELPAGELEYISERGRMTQGVLWTGDLASATVRATMLMPGAPASTLAGEPDADHACPWGDIEQCAWAHAADPCAERAGLLHELCAQADVALAHPGTGLLIADARADHPMLTPFRVRAVMPWRREKVRDWLRAHDGGLAEIKTRGKAADTDAEQRALRGKGDTPHTVFVLRFGQAVRAVICERP
jgi:hypothetical protein